MGFWYQDQEYSREEEPRYRGLEAGVCLRTSVVGRQGQVAGGQC